MSAHERMSYSPPALCASPPQNFDPSPNLTDQPSVVRRSKTCSAGCIHALASPDNQYNIVADTGPHGRGGRCEFLSNAQISLPTAAPHTGHTSPGHVYCTALSPHDMGTAPELITAPGLPPSQWGGSRPAPVPQPGTAPAKGRAEVTSNVKIHPQTNQLADHQSVMLLQFFAFFSRSKRFWPSAVGRRDSQRGRAGLSQRCPDAADARTKWPTQTDQPVREWQGVIHMDANGLPRLWVRFLHSDPLHQPRAAGSPRPTPWATLHHANCSYRPN
jgi:hypothetical protein